MASILLAAAACAAGLLAVVGSAQAQWPRDDRYFLLRDPFRRDAPFFAPFGGFRRERPPPRQAPVVAEPPPDQPVATVYNSSADADRERGTPPSEYVIVFGDSLADQLAQGLAEAFVSDRPEVAIVRKTRASSGFVRADFYNWPAQIPGLLAGEKASAIAIMLGANDRQALRDDGGPIEFRTPRWRDGYAKRVEETLNHLKTKGVPIFIIGTPPMRVGRLFEDMPYVNEILREQATKAGAIYVDIWDGFVDEDGEFMMTGPALDGQTRRLRLPDGVHFTKAGARKLAHYVERDLIRLFDLGRGRGLQLPQEAPPEVAPPPAGRPVAGPVLPLTQPAGPVGQLAGAGPRAASPADPVAARVLTEGLPPTPVAGRADDFRWPPAAAAAALLGLSSGPGGVPAEAQDSPLATAPAGQGNAAPANAAAPSVPNIMQPPVAPAGRPAPARAANQNLPAQKATQGQPAVPRPPAAVPTVPEANRAR